MHERNKFRMTTTNSTSIAPSVWEQTLKIKVRSKSPFKNRNIQQQDSTETQ